MLPRAMFEPNTSKGVISTMKLSLLCVAALALSAFAVSVEAQPAYTITPIGDIPGATSNRTYHAHNLNDKGEVVGSVEVLNPGGVRGFFWRNGQIAEIESMTGPRGYIEAFAVNNLVRHGLPHQGSHRRERPSHALRSDHGRVEDQQSRTDSRGRVDSRGNGSWSPFLLTPVPAP